jgi:hypothetical protein
MKNLLIIGSLLILVSSCTSKESTEEKKEEVKDTVKTESVVVVANDTLAVDSLKK